MEMQNKIESGETRLTNQIDKRKNKRQKIEKMQNKQKVKD
jgi:hypothetical protein